MPRSPEYRALQHRIVELRAHFLPQRFHPTGDYTDRQLDRTGAFIILAHAEIEFFLESIVVETAKNAADAWISRKLMTEPLVSMLAYCDNQNSIPPKLQGPDSVELNNRVIKASETVCQYANSQNNGIKERDILKLLMPVGIQEADIDPTWLADIDSFGRVRGKLAHTSKRVQVPPNPQDEFQTVNRIVSGLTDIDKTLFNFRLK